MVVVFLSHLKFFGDASVGENIVVSLLLICIFIRKWEGVMLANGRRI